MRPAFKAKLDAAIQARAVAAKKHESTLDAQIQASEIAIQTFVAERYRDAKNQITTLFRQDEGVSKIIVSVRDRDQFYRLVNYCNKTYGKGSDKWTVGGKVLKFIDPTKYAYNPPTHRVWMVMQPNLDLTHLRSI